MTILSDIQPATWIALIGWLVTTIGWWVSLRNQKKLFRHQVKNTARGEIVAALRARQDAVLALSRTILPVSMGRRHLDEIRCQRAFDGYRAIPKSDDARWITLLEEYEAVFPKTAKCRHELVRRTMKLSEDLRFFFRCLIDPADRAHALDSIDSLMNRLSDEVGLLEDLLVYVQNETLGAVFGTKAPFWRPTDERAVRIVTGKRGYLEIRGGMR
jgi:hypothetical protein